MCGIYGFVGLKSPNLLKKMGQTLAHRGPDDQNEFIGGKIGLGYRRLAIIDTKGSYQPLYNENKNISLFFNGEIYNYKDLRQQLVGHQFQTDGDGETIIHWYEKHGPQGFKDLNGIFGFSLLDKKNQKLLLVRDHFGIKPLYYFQNDAIFVFASEIKAIIMVLKSLKIKIKPNNEVIKRYLQKRVHDNDRLTFFQNIFRLPQGSYLEFNLKTNQSNVYPFWDLLPDKSVLKKTDKENIAEFKRLFTQAVERQLMSEVPIGTALSGGLDSSAVVLMVNKLLQNNSRIKKIIGERQKTFSAEFPGGINNEKEYIDEVVSCTGVKSYVVEPKRLGLWSEIKEVIYQQDEPMISSGPYAQWKVMQLAHQQGIRVMLDGQGADELLSGYDPYYLVYYRELFKKRQFLNLIFELFLGFSIVKKYLQEKLEYHLGIKKSFNPNDLFTFATNYAQNITKDNLNKRLREDIFFYSLPSLLRYEDRNSMSQSIEARVPFLDIDLVQFVASLPSNYKIRWGKNKWIMRQALKDILPKKILERTRKIGFTTPEIAWLRESENEIKQIFNSQTFNSRPYFKPDLIREKYAEFVQGKNDESLVFWRIINLELWLRMFID